MPRAVSFLFLLALTTIVLDVAQAQNTQRSRRGRRPGEVITPAAKGERIPATLKVGDVAPDFTLPRSDDPSQTVTLSHAVRERPAVLVFGSISCSPFRRQMEQVDRLCEAYGDRASCYMVYIREAHPDSKIFVRTDPGADEQLLTFPQTDDQTLRTEHASTCRATLDLSMPVLVDRPDNAVNQAYAAWPIRIAVVGADGRIAFYGEQGPQGFHPEELREWLEENL